MEAENFSRKSADEIVCEAPFEYIPKRDGGYTLEDYYALPDDQRVELIDGVFYDMAAPAVSHQIASFHIGRQLADFIDTQNGVCLPLISPVDVQLDCDDRTMVQPDVLVVCDRSKVINRCIYGAPDLVIEVLSESTARKDQTIKPAKYRGAGVREYWMIDLRKEKVILYDFEHGIDPIIFGMDKPVSVRIFDGKCKIRFDELREEVRPLLASR
ncbi:MAG: Uma2 family endonuclease [Lachnospiraceae bacterium]|nr:Uma2 family endonuclease [Lachnospiraceae bacterium]